MLRYIIKTTSRKEYQIAASSVTVKAPTMKNLSTQKYCSLVLILLSPCLLSCGGSPAAEQTNNTHVENKQPHTKNTDPKRESALKELIAEERASPEQRIEIRQAAIEYIKAQFPQWSVRGVTALSYTGNLYLVGVDLISGQQERTLSLIARLFVNESGVMYWKVEALSSELSQALSGYTLLKYRKLQKDYKGLEDYSDE